MFPLEELMLHPIVGELFELLECHKRPGTHGFMILSVPLSETVLLVLLMRHRLQVLIPSELNAQLSQAAQRSRVSKSEWVRCALEKSLPYEGPSSDPVARLGKLNAPTAGIDQMLAEIVAGRR